MFSSLLTPSLPLLFLLSRKSLLKVERRKFGYHHNLLKQYYENGRHQQEEVFVFVSIWRIQRIKASFWSPSSFHYAPPMKPGPWQADVDGAGVTGIDQNSLFPFFVTPETQQEIELHNQCQLALEEWANGCVVPHHLGRNIFISDRWEHTSPSNLLS